MIKERDVPFTTLNLTTSATRQCSKKRSSSKRWFEVEVLNNETDKDEVDTAWSWPVKCKGTPPIQPVRYCYKDKRSTDNLEDILNHAIARWGPAMQEQVSALSIDLDEGTGNDPHVYCSDPKISGDALVISNQTKDGDDEWDWDKCDTQSTTGYIYESDERSRHTLDFCHLKTDAVEKMKPWAIRAMMHELGM